MPDSKHQRIRSLFDGAMALPKSQREPFLDGQCGGDAGLRQRLDAMLAAADDERFLGAPTGPQPAEGADDALREGPGTRIGPYHLLEKLGEGGFGVVFMAEQTKPVMRRVALKIIKVGMDTRQVVARFEQERQALAMMDHANIARVLDAGATATGRPYFVMELVKGEPLAAYCDQHKLPIDARIELFAQVCSAVQHAHQKGIIHRDIKPSNILVGEQDGRPLAKVIDFGIAKATSAKLTDKTLFTEHKQVIGTLQYMSPEQAHGSVDIDTRTDVYSLGVVLYELLTGSTPFDVNSIAKTMYSEIQRMIREDDPPKPSTRLRESAELLGNIAARRNIEPKRLGVLVRGELDWIVMKALEKDRARRYETPSALAMDLRRFLRGEAIDAAPPSPIYRLRKFVRRHRFTALAAAAVAAALLVGVAAFAWQASIARAERDKAEQARSAEAVQRGIAGERAAQLEQVATFQAQMLERFDPTDAGVRMMHDLRLQHAEALANNRAPANDRTASEQAFATELARVNATDAAVSVLDHAVLAPAVAAVVTRFADQPIVDATLRQTLATLYTKLGRYNDARPLLEWALATRSRVLGEEHRDTLHSVNDMGHLFEKQGKFVEAEPFLRRAYEGRTRVLGATHIDTLKSLSNLGGNLRYQGRTGEAEPLLRSCLASMQRELGTEHRDTLITTNVMGYLLIDLGKPAEAQPYWQTAYETGRRVFGADDVDTLVWTNNLGGLFGSLGRDKDAERYYREAYEGMRRVKGEEHPSTLDFASNVASNLNAQGRYAESEPLSRVVLDTRRRVLGDEHGATLDSMQGLGNVLRKQGRIAEAEPLLRKALEVHRRVAGPEHRKTLISASMLASLLANGEHRAEAESLYRSVLATSRKELGDDHPDSLVTMNNLGNLLAQQDKLEEAEPMLRAVLAARRRLSGDDHPETLVSQSGVGFALEQQNKLAEAETLYRDATDKFRRVLGNAHTNTLSSIGNIVSVLITQARFAEAEPLQREVVAGNERALGGQHARVGNARRNLGRVLTGLQRFAEAEAELLAAERVLSIAQGVSAENKKKCVAALIELYDAWDQAEPDKGHAASATTWRAR